MQTSDTELTSCVAGREWCVGIDGLFWGDLSCADCWMAAPETALEIQMGAV